MNHPQPEESQKLQHQPFNGCLRIVIPAEMEFSDLQVTRGSDGLLGTNTEAVLRILEASAICPGCFFSDDGRGMSALVMVWYQMHLMRGGEQDAVIEDLLEECRLEEERGGGFSYAPGHA